MLVLLALCCWIYKTFLSGSDKKTNGVDKSSPTFNDTDDENNVINNEENELSNGKCKDGSDAAWPFETCKNWKLNHVDDVWNNSDQAHIVSKCKTCFEI